MILKMEQLWVIFLVRKQINIMDICKKAIYILVRERTGVSSQYITNVINKIKIIYGKLYKHYREGFEIEKLSWYQLQDIINN